MYRRVAQRLTLRTAIALTICIALLPIPSVSLLISGAAQGQREERKGKPKPGKPEGVWPDLEEVKQQKQIEHEAPPPIPSTIRSERNDGKPWDGRRVGDPEPRGAERNDDEPLLAKRISERRSKKTLRAHARLRMTLPPPPHDQFVSNFFNYALVRSPNSDETTYWHDQLRVAYGQGATSLKLAGVELGRTLFRSAEYAARNRDAHGYVYDLYKTYLMRDPDAGGRLRDIGHGDDGVVIVRRRRVAGGHGGKGGVELVRPERVVAELVGDPRHAEHALDGDRPDGVLPTLAAVRETGADLDRHADAP